MRKGYVRSNQNDGRMRTGRAECRLYEDMNVRRPTRQEAGMGCEAGKRVGSRWSLEMDRGGEPAGIVTL